MPSYTNLSMLQGVNQLIEPLVELSFPVRGRSLPADHGYGLYASLVHLFPTLREQSQLSILTIPGIPDKQGKIFLSDQSCLQIRVPVPKIPLVYPLAGKKVTIGSHEVQVGIPTVSVVRPVPTLRARIVTLKGYMEADLFLAAVRRQLDALGIAGELSIPLNRDGTLSRKTIKIKCHTIVGFTTEVTGLNDEDSLKLQQWGCGGRRHMGCGVFCPVSTFDSRKALSRPKGV